MHQCWCHTFRTSVQFTAFLRCPPAALKPRYSQAVVLPLALWISIGDTPIPKGHLSVPPSAVVGPPSDKES